MSPRKIIHKYLVDDNIVTVTTESETSFNVGPASAMQILGTTKSPLIKHDKDDVEMKNGERVYTDASLLRIATELRRGPSITEAENGLTVLKTQDTETLLDIPWSSAQKQMRR